MENRVHFFVKKERKRYAEDFCLNFVDLAQKVLIDRFFHHLLGNPTTIVVLLARKLNCRQLQKSDRHRVLEGRIQKSIVTYIC